MTRIVLEVSEDKDLDLLLALLDRLDIRILEKITEGVATAATKEDKDLILKGLPAREDFEDFIQAFEKSRQDRPLPGRQ